jgi:hypothetical protein
VNANAYQAYGKTFYKQNPGDKIIIRNGEVCTTYQMTDSKDWNAIDRKSITGVRPGGGNGTGGGGSGGGGYTGPIGGGDTGSVTVGGTHGGGGYTGSVTVGGPTPEKPSRPTHQD